jgi:hypothetical protein
MTRVYQFADDSMRGRMAGSPEAMKGTEYIAAELKRLGLQPAGENSTFFQDVPFGVQTLDSSSTIAVGETTLKAGVDFVAQAQLGTPAQTHTLEVIYGGLVRSCRSYPRNRRRSRRRSASRNRRAKRSSVERSRRP